VLFGAGGDDVVALFRQQLEYLDDLGISFAGAVYHFRKTASDMPMVIDLGKTNILERQMPQLFDGFVNIEIAVFYLL
jgi:hypothetical protein